MSIILEKQAYRGEISQYTEIKWKGNTWRAVTPRDTKWVMLDKNS